jgi:hypothetical protein
LAPGVNVIKLFCSSPNKLKELLTLRNLFQPSLIFSGKAKYTEVGLLNI